MVFKLEVQPAVRNNFYTLPRIVGVVSHFSSQNQVNLFLFKSRYLQRMFMRLAQRGFGATFSPLI